jgi:hypothetical protein
MVYNARRRYDAGKETTMIEPITVPAPNPDLTRPPKSKWERKQQAFLCLLPDLLATHRGQYVAVHDERVVESGSDKLVVLLRAYAAYVYVPIYVGLVAERPLPAERWPHYRVIEK